MDESKYQIDNNRLLQGQVIGDYAQVHQHFSSPQPAPQPLATSAWTIPFQRNRFFLGQDDLLNHLHKRLTRGTTTALTQVQAISGLGGIGKTQIAIEYAYRYRESYPFVFWIRAEHLETLTSDLVSLAPVLQLPQQDDADQIKMLAAVKQWLATQPGWLLILDNADDLSLLSPFLPPQHMGAILLTTRASQTQPLAEPLAVEQMDEHLGAEFLLRRARLLAPGQALEDASSEDRQAAREICLLVGGLPLALDQAGAYIDETQCATQDYLNFYRHDQQVRATLLHRRGKVTAAHPEPVATTWALAFARVEQASPAAADLLRACAFLAPDLIPEDMLRQGATYWGSVLESVAGQPFQWNETIGELLKYTLLRRSREHQALSIHRLVQTVIKDAMDEPQRQQWMDRTIQAMERVFPDGTDPANWPTCKRFLPHAQASAVLIENHDLRSEKAASLLHGVATYLNEHARYREAEPLFQRALRIWEQQVGPEHPQVAYTLNGLAFLYYQQGKYGEAEPLYQRALHIWEQSEHPDVAYPLTNLASLYYQQGKYGEAEPLYQRALHIWEQQLGSEHPQVAYPLNGLASLYYQQGKYGEAERLYQQALRIREQQLGPEHPGMADLLNGLALLYYQQGKYGEAEPLFQQALHIWKQQLGPEHPLVAYPLNGLALLYYQQGKYVEAEPLYQRAVRIWEGQLGPEHPLTQKARKNYAIFLRATGRHEQAKKLEG